MKKRIDKSVFLDLHLFKKTNYMLAAFQMKAVLEGWTKQEIELVSDQIVGLEQVEQFKLLSMYCQPLIHPSVALSQSDVRFLLAHLGMETHYLGQKEITLWDAYDWSNYTSLKRKATSALKRVYGLYCDSVDPEDKYEVTSPPSVLYESFEQACEAFNKLNDGKTNLYAIWKKI